MRASQLKQLFHKEEIVQMYRPPRDEMIDEAARRMVDLAKKTKKVVRMTFDGIRLSANPGDTAGAIMRRYNSARSRRERRINHHVYGEAHGD